MTLEKIASIIRMLIQFIGMLLLIPVIAQIPFIGNLLEALEFIDMNLTEMYSIVQTLIGFAVTIYGFFFDPVRATVKTLFIPKMEVSRFSTRAAA